MSIAHEISDRATPPLVPAWSARPRLHSLTDVSKASGSEIDYRRRLGKVIVQLREGHRMSQAVLAEQINRSEAALSRWETGKATPTAFDLHEIARVFAMPGGSLDVLLYPPAVYGPEMERVFASIGEHLAAAAESGVVEGLRRGRQSRSRPVPDKPVRSPRPRARDTGAGRG